MLVSMSLAVITVLMYILMLRVNKLNFKNYFIGCSINSIVYVALIIMGMLHYKMIKSIFELSIIIKTDIWLFFVGMFLFQGIIVAILCVIYNVIGKKKSELYKKR